MNSLSDALGAHPIAALVSVVVIVAVIALMHGWFGGPKPPAQQQRRDKSAAWAKPADVKDLIVTEDEPDRIELGRLGSHMIAAPTGRSVTVIAPTGAGKTPRLVVPAVLQHDGPAVVASVKGDALALTLDHRAKHGPVWIFDPTHAAGHGTCTWSPLLDATTYGGALKAATWVMESSKAEGGSGVQDQKFWDTLGKNLLAPLMFAAASTGRHMRDVSHWVLMQNEEDVQTILGQLGDEDAIAHWAAHCGRESRTKSNIATTAEQILDGFAHPDVREALTPRDSANMFTPSKLLDEDGTLYVVAPEEDQALFTAVFEALVNSVLREVASRSAKLGGQPINPRLLLMIDEAANVAPLRKLDKIASAGANQGILLSSIWQDVGQIESIYGPAKTRVVLSNHTAALFLPGIKDEKTLKMISDLVGPHKVLDRQQSNSRSGQGSASSSWRDEDVAPAAYIRQLPTDMAIAIVGRYKPMRVQLRGWYEDKKLRAKVNKETAKQFDRQFSKARR